MGAVTALGQDVGSTWDGLVAGRSGVRDDRGVRPLAARLRGSPARSRDFDPSAVLDRKDMRRTDRYIQFGLVGARQAMDDAGPAGAARRRDGRADRRDPGLRPRRREHAVRQRAGRWPSAGPTGSRRSSSRWASPTSAPGRSRSPAGPLGPNFATVSACATGGHALGEAWETIRRGDADVMIAGGVEAGIHEATVGGFASMKALSTRNDDPAAASRPFDKARDGFVMGEGVRRGDPRGARARRGPRRRAARRAGRLRRDRRRVAHHAAGAGRHRRGPGGAARPRRRRAWTRPRSTT